MNLDDKVCYCFHITQRKLINYLRIHQPRVVSQLSLCGGAGTGCGWCIPFLKKMFQEGSAGLDVFSREKYELERAAYIREGKGTPPAGAEPAPEA